MFENLLIRKILLSLAAIGAINWGLFGIAGIDAVALIFGAFTPLARLVYIAVGAAGIYLMAQIFNKD